MEKGNPTMQAMKVRLAQACAQPAQCAVPVWDMILSLRHGIHLSRCYRLAQHRCQQQRKRGVCVQCILIKGLLFYLKGRLIKREIERSPSC